MVTCRHEWGNVVTNHLHDVVMNLNCRAHPFVEKGYCLTRDHNQLMCLLLQWTKSKPDAYIVASPITPGSLGESSRLARAARDLDLLKWTQMPGVEVDSIPVAVDTFGTMGKRELGHILKSGTPPCQ